jgi:hypothetical protein
MPVTESIINKIKVERMTGRTGQSVKNQYIIETADGRYFQSYAAVVAFQSHCMSVTRLDSRYWRYSSTTMKYLSKFLGEPMRDIIRKAENGIYTLVERLVE